MGRPDSLVGVLCSPDSSATAVETAANDLLGEFFAGYPVERLRVLLRSGVPAAVRSGVWIASELGERAAPLVDDMPALLRHPIRYVRFFAVDIVLAAADTDHGAVIAEAITLILDSDGAIRWKSLQLLSRAAAGQLAAAVPHLSDERLHDLTAWLVHASPQNILPRIDNDDPTTRLFAVAAAARVAEVDRSPLDSVAAGPDMELASFAREQLQQLPRRRSR
jgi:hypothetical protein